MKKLFTYGVNRMAAHFALWSFVLSSIWFLLCTATEATILTGTGMALLMIYGIMTPIILLILLVNAFVNYKDLKQHINAIFMMLLSLAITLFYSKLISEF